MKPKLKMPDEDQDGADVGDEEPRPIGVGLRVELDGLGRRLRGGQRGLVDIGVGQHVVHPQADHGGADDALQDRVGRFLVDDLARRGQVGRDVDDGLDLVGLEGGLGRRAVRVRDQDDRAVRAGRRSW